MGEVDPVAERELRRALDASVDREPEPEPGTWLLPGLERAHRAAEGVHVELVETVVAAQVRVVGALDARLSDPVARDVAVAV